MCATEIPVRRAMPRVVRLMAHVETARPARRSGTSTSAARPGSARTSPSESQNTTIQNECCPSPTRAAMAPSGVPPRAERRCVVTMPKRVLVAGTGLIGTSVALALRAKGTEIFLSDACLATASLPRPWGRTVVPDLRDAKGIADVAVLAVPQAAVRTELSFAEQRAVADFYTDVASVKVLPAAQARSLGCDLVTYVPGHPMAGRERRGPGAAQADLFVGRSWALCPLAETSRAALDAVTGLAVACGAEPVVTDPATHDQWVALVSHAPHLVAVAMAARLASAGVPGDALRLAGGGCATLLGSRPGTAGCRLRSCPRTPGRSRRSSRKSPRTWRRPPARSPRPATSPGCSSAAGPGSPGSLASPAPVRAGGPPARRKRRPRRERRGASRAPSRAAPGVHGRTSRRPRDRGRSRDTSARSRSRGGARRPARLPQFRVAG